MTPEIKKLYRQARKAGYPASHALRVAKTVSRFQELKALGLVEMRAEPEDENYFDIYDEPEAYTNTYGKRVTAKEARKEIEDILERDGCWWTGAYWRLSTKDEWELADSCGMHIGYSNVLDWQQNWYVPDEMRSAIDEYDKASYDALWHDADDCLAYG